MKVHDLISVLSTLPLTGEVVINVGETPLTIKKIAPHVRLGVIPPEVYVTLTVGEDLIDPASINFGREGI